MMNIQSINIRRQGFNHINKGIVCQDYALCDTSIPDTVILLLSDGHGSSKYFRSDRGSQFACEIARDAVKEFIQEFRPDFRYKVALIQEGPASSDRNASEERKRIDSIFRRLGGAIVYRWVNRVIEDWYDNPPADHEMRNLSPDDYRFYTEGEIPRNQIPKAYGCTLQVAVRTPHYWFALHIGDGKIVGVKKYGTIYEPVPWDPACHDTTTTSLCEIDPGRLRYAYGEDVSDVCALFLASDGMDDSFANFEELASVYGINVLNKIYSDGWDSFSAGLERFLDSISKSRSGDDMSLACWVDMETLPSMLPKILKDDIRRIESQIQIVRSNLIKCREEENNYQWQIEEKESISKACDDRNDLRTKIEQLVRDYINSLPEGVVNICKKAGIRLGDFSMPAFDDERKKIETELVRLGIEKKVRTDNIPKYENRLSSLEKERENILRQYEQFNLVSSIGDNHNSIMNNDNAEGSSLLSDKEIIDEEPGMIDSSQFN